MILILELVLMLMTFIVASVTQYRYAQVGYPNSWKWKGILFVTGALWVFSVLLVFSGVIYSGAILTWKLMLFNIFVVLFFGLIIAFLLPYKLRWVIPKKR